MLVPVWRTDYRAHRSQGGQLEGKRWWWLGPRWEQWWCRQAGGSRIYFGGHERRYHCSANIIFLSSMGRVHFHTALFWSWPPDMLLRQSRVWQGTFRGLIGVCKPLVFLSFAMWMVSPRLVVVVVLHHPGLEWCDTCHRPELDLHLEYKPSRVRQSSSWLLAVFNH